MATAVTETFTNHRCLSRMSTLSSPKPPRRAWFSYAAYAKNLINYLWSSNILVERGLSDAEFAAVETSFNFTFPPDLRSILQEGLAVGSGFPNWRSSSEQQLEILTNLPILGICKEVSRNELWIESWGDKPEDNDGAAKLARGFLQKAPILVPIYRNFYIPSTPCIAGNPVFYVHGGEVKLWSFDIAGFFQKVEFRMSGSEEVLRRPRLSNLFTAPAWAATEARRIEFWTEMAERKKNRRWWRGVLGGCLEELCWRLRKGGWKEEDVREMMMMDGCDESNHEDNVSDKPPDAECVLALSARLLRAGWKAEDVVESLGFPVDFQQNGGESCFDFQRTAKL